MRRDRGAVGQHWESVVGAYLQDRGLEIIERGYRCRLGELDLVCRDGATLVIVEVRARSSSALVKAKETIDYAKRRRLVRATRHFLMRHPHLFDQPIRFDIVAVDGIDQRSPDIDWVKNAFEAG